jgi:hypothetical protein
MSLSPGFPELRFTFTGTLGNTPKIVTVCPRVVTGSVSSEEMLAAVVGVTVPGAGFDACNASAAPALTDTSTAIAATRINSLTFMAAPKRMK